MKDNSKYITISLPISNCSHCFVGIEKNPWSVYTVYSPTSCNHGYLILVRRSPAQQPSTETHLSSNMEDKAHLETDPQATLRSSQSYSMSRSGSERSSSSGEIYPVPLSDQNLDFPEILPFGLDDIGDVKNDVTTIFNDYHRNIVSEIRVYFWRSLKCLWND